VRERVDVDSLMSIENIAFDDLVLRSVTSHNDAAWPTTTTTPTMTTTTSSLFAATCAKCEQRRADGVSGYVDVRTNAWICVQVRGCPLWLESDNVERRALEESDICA
jgi:hypothetical protein